MAQLPRSTAKDFFSALLALITLYAGAISFMTLLFQYVNTKFPDALGYSYGSLEAIRSAMAALIIVWPMYLLVSWFIHKEEKASGEKEVGHRKPGMYLTLFVAAIALVVDLVTLVNYFLNGEITTRFILKVLVVLLTVGAVFWFELWELKHDLKEKTTVYKTVAIASSIIVIGTILSGFLLVGSPNHQRQVRFDEQRTNDLITIQSEIINLYQRTGSLPATLQNMNDSLSGFTVPTDPETLAAYEYTVATTDQLRFSLCTTFNQATIDTAYSRPMAYYNNDNWSHQAGRVCFDRTIDPLMYPRFETPTGTPLPIKTIQSF